MIKNIFLFPVFLISIFFGNSLLKAEVKKLPEYKLIGNFKWTDEATKWVERFPACTQLVAPIKPNYVAVSAPKKPYRIDRIFSPITYIKTGSSYTTRWEFDTKYGKPEYRAKNCSFNTGGIDFVISSDSWLSEYGTPDENTINQIDYYELGDYSFLGKLVVQVNDQNKGYALVEALKNKHKPCKRNEWGSYRNDPLKKFTSNPNILCSDTNRIALRTSDLRNGYLTITLFPKYQIRKELKAYQLAKYKLIRQNTMNENMKNIKIDSNSF